MKLSLAVLALFGMVYMAGAAGGWKVTVSTVPHITEPYRGESIKKLQEKTEMEYFKRIGEYPKPVKGGGR